jgi:hypothetical protein
MANPSSSGELVRWSIYKQVMRVREFEMKVTSSTSESQTKSKFAHCEWITPHGQFQDHWFPVSELTVVSEDELRADHTGGG